MFVGVEKVWVEARLETGHFLIKHFKIGNYNGTSTIVVIEMVVITIHRQGTGHVAATRITTAGIEGHDG